MPVTTRLALAAAVALLAACGGKDAPTAPTDNRALGSHTGSVSGGLTLNTSGLALFGQGEAQESGTLGFALAMGSTVANSEEFKDLVLIGRPASGVPTAGTYAIAALDGESEPADDAFVLVAFLVSPQGHDLMCSGTGGTLTVTGTGGGKLKGSYTAPVSCFDLDAPAGEPIAATVQGTFDAVSANRPLGTVAPGADARVTLRRIR